ncbi:orotate phosphoribosyltransferase, partial [Candidatus Pacearchaeota archaeon]
MNTRALARTLYNINAIRFGEFRLKSGILSPFYIDLRVTISYPDVLKTIAETFWERIQPLSFDRITGVPYTALPFAVALSLEHNLPMVLRRKEAKSYGTKKIIEGEFKKGDTCLVIEDVITSGASVFETIEPLETAGLIVSDIAVLIDREQG